MSSNVWWSDVGQGNVCSKSVGGNLILVGKKIFGGYDENSSANWTVLKFLPWKSLWSWSISTHPWPVVVKSSTGWGCDPNIEPSLPSIMKVWSRCHRSKSSAYLSKHLYIDQSAQCFCLDFFLHISSHVVYSAPTSLTPRPPASHPGSPQSLCPTVLDRVRPCRDGLLLCSFLFCRTPLTFLVTGEREEKEEWSRVEEKGWIYWRGARAQVDASPVGIMVDDEASGCQGQLHTGPGPHIHLSRSHFNAWKSTLSWPQNFSSSHKWLKAGIPIQHELPLGGAKKKKRDVSFKCFLSVIFPDNKAM